MYFDLKLNIIKLFFSLSLFITISAYQICFQQDKSIKTCPDTYYKVGFCCNLENGLYEDCCYYTKIWALWYFWFGIFLFLAIIGGCIGGIVRMRKNSKDDDSSRSSESPGPEEVVFVAQQTTTPPQAMAESPPSYEQLQAQAVNSQTQEYAKYGTSVDKPDIAQ